MAKYCFGVDVGGTTVKLGCFDTEGTLLENGKSIQGQKTAGRQFFLMWRTAFWIK